jgi:hypothetical protein
VNANNSSSSKVWTASKSSADTITRVSTTLGSPSSSSSFPSTSVKIKNVSASIDNLTDFPKLGESFNKMGGSSGDVVVVGGRVDRVEDDGMMEGWNVRRSSPMKDQSSPPSSSSSSLLSLSNDIFSAMAERPAMSTDYTFKPSERTIKAAEAKRLADSQQKAAAAAAASSLSLPGSTKGDFDEFLSSSSASYISNFSSSIRGSYSNQGIFLDLLCPFSHVFLG